MPGAKTRIYIFGNPYIASHLTTACPIINLSHRQKALRSGLGLIQPQVQNSVLPFGPYTFKDLQHQELPDRAQDFEFYIE